MPKTCPKCGFKLESDRGAKRYGEDPERPGETEGVEQVRALRASGLTIRAVAEHMQAEKWPLRRGQWWNPGTIWRILKRAEAKTCDV